VCKSCNQPTRVGHRIEEDGTKTRICRKCEADL
jgi:large subunit ribosomal protein L24